MESPKLGYFTDEHVRVFSTLAPQIAIAIENARLYERVVRSEARLERDLDKVARGQCPDHSQQATGNRYGL